MNETSINPILAQVAQEVFDETRGYDVNTLVTRFATPARLDMNVASGWGRIEGFRSATIHHFGQTLLSWAKTALHRTEGNSYFDPYRRDSGAKADLLAAEIVWRYSARIQQLREIVLKTPEDQLRGNVSHEDIRALLSPMVPCPPLIQVRLQRLTTLTLPGWLYRIYLEKGYYDPMPGAVATT